MMNKFDFDQIIARRGTNSYKWDLAKDDEVLPFWVADMDFVTAPAITQALKKRAIHGIFGYTKVPQEYYEAIINWFAIRHNWDLQKEWIVCTSGVVPALSAIIKALCKAGDGVLVQTPVYNCFFSSIKNNDCEVVENKLIYTNNTYKIDFEDLKTKASNPKVKLLILCNPHNPAGRVWTYEELSQICDICIQNNVTIVSDEIHCELIMPGYKYTPLASISDEILNQCVVCNSISKAFNTAGLQNANIICANAQIREKIVRAININEICDVNPFGVDALMAAYNESYEWLCELNAYIYQNYLFMKDFCQSKLPNFQIGNLEGTYLVWMNCLASQMSSNELGKALVNEAKIWLNSGTMYGSCGEGFMRWNIACPRSRLEEGLKRFEKFVNDKCF